MGFFFLYRLSAACPPGRQKTWDCEDFVSKREGEKLSLSVKLRSCVGQKWAEANAHERKLMDFFEEEQDKSEHELFRTINC